MLTARVLRLALVLPLLAACGGNVYFDDDEAAPRVEGQLFRDQPDHLSLPYALGTSLRISIRGGGSQTDKSGWRVVSSDPQVLLVDKFFIEDGELRAECSAAGEGRASLSVYDETGDLRRSAGVFVKAPDRARLLAHGPLRVLGNDSALFPSAEVQEARVLVGGKGVFAVAYFRGEERLFGHGIAAADPAAQVTVENKTTYGPPVTEWLLVTPQAAGAFVLRLAPRGTALVTMPLVGVAEAELASLVLSLQSDANSTDEKRWVLAQARDAAGRDVHGVYSDWTLGGATQLGESGSQAERQGDLFRFSTSAENPLAKLVASHGALSASLDVRAKTGYVKTTTYFGCSAVPGAPAPGAGAAVLLLLGLVRRRRSR